jgi:hypothetical protein
MAFSERRGVPAPFAEGDVIRLARLGLRPHERLATAQPRKLHGHGTSVVIGVALDDGDARAYAIAADGTEFPYATLRDTERALYAAQFGRMSVRLFEAQEGLDDADLVEVNILVSGDFAEPELPPDQADGVVSIEAYQAWVAQERLEQRARIAAAKAPLLRFLDDHGAEIVRDYRALPMVHARVTAELLRSEELASRDEIVEIQPVEVEDGSAELLGYAGWKSMRDGALAAGGVNCSSPKCDGGGLLVGLWEEDTGVNEMSQGAVALNNTRLGNTARYYWEPKSCTVDADCLGGQMVKRCVGGVCVADHTTWVAASVGMTGTYKYDNTIPCNVTPSDSTPNAPSSVTFPSAGAWNASYAVANEQLVDGFDWLMDEHNVIYVNRSQSDLEHFKSAAVNWAARHHGVFFTQAGGNDAPFGYTKCSQLWNGVCVGWYNYETYDDLSTHRRHQHSTYRNYDTGSYVLERPHLLAPGSHVTNVAGGLHLPDLTNCATPKRMRSRDYADDPIRGSSLAAPMVLGAAMQAHQYAGWFSALALPQVNKAVLLASTVDANADGPVGMSTTWSQLGDAEDGAGQIDLQLVQQTIDNGRYQYKNLADTDFVSCGANCREYTMASVLVPAYTRVKVALVWHACQTTETSDAFVNNDLDLVVRRPGACFFTHRASVAVDSETEMVYDDCLAGYPGNGTYLIKIRIKDGATLNACNTNPYERAAIAWSIQ